MRKKIAIVAGAVAAALVLLLAVGPAMVDWSGARGDIAARLQAALGRPVAIDGPVRLRLLPSPEATVDGVRIAAPGGAGPADLATIPAVHLRFALLPLLAGRVEVAALVLDHPAIHLERLADGRADGRATPAAKAPAAPAAARPPAAAGGGGTVLAVGTVEIVDGSVTYGGNDGAAARLDGLDARLAMDSAAGPFAATATARWHGIAVALDARLGRWTPGQAVPLAATVALPGADARLTLAGSVGGGMGVKGAGPEVTGRLTLAAPSPAALGGPFLAALADPLAGKANLAANADEATLSDLLLRSGPVVAHGSIDAAFARTPRIDVSLNVPSLDLGALDLGALARARPAPARAAHSAAPPPAALSVALPPPAGAAGFVLPSHLFVDTVLTVGELPWHGEVARQGHLEATLDQGELVVEQAGLLLPGGTAVKADGTVAARDGRPQFDGHLGIVADDVRQALAWMGIDAAAIPADRLHRLVLSAAVQAAPERLALDHLELGLDSIAATGSATLRTGGARPAVALTLAADTVDLDSYLPAPAAPPLPAPPLPTTSAAAPPAAGPAAAPAEGAVAPAPPGLDASLALQVHRLIYRRLATDNLAIAASLTDGTLALGHATASIAGSTVTASGTLSGMGAAQPRLDGVVLHLDSPEPGRLARALGDGGAASVLDRAGSLTADANLSGGVESIDAKLRATAAGLVLTADGTVADPLSGRRIALAIGAHAEDAAQAIRLVAPGFHPRAALGPLALAAHIAGNARALDLSGLDFSVGAARVTGTAQANLTGRRPMITANLVAGALDLDPFLATGPAATAPLRHPRHAASDRRRAAAAPAARAAAAPAARAGGSPLSHQPLDLSVLEAADGVVDLKADSLAWHGWRIEAPLAHLVLDNGTATLDKLAGKLEGGSLALTLRLSGGSLPQLTGALALSGADIGQAGLGIGALRLTRGRMDADGRFAAAGRSSADMAARLGGDAKVRVQDGTLTGFDLAAVDRQLAVVQNVGSLLGLVQAGLGGGSTRFSALAGSFHADNGVVATRDTRLDAEGGSATAIATVDLPRWTLASTVDIHLANSAAPPLSLRFDGPLDHPRKIADVNALQRYLVQRVLGRQAAPAADGQPQPLPSGKQLLRDLFRGLGGK